MVNLTPVLQRIIKSPANRFWKRQRVLQYCGHFYGRRRNVYSIALRSLWKAWEIAQRNRPVFKNTVNKLWMNRIGGACEELGLRGYFPFVHGLARSNIALNRKVLADIAWSEPRTFRSLVDIARLELSKDPAQNTSPPDNVIDYDQHSNKSGPLQ
ncbi:39S ribosomal protein L20 [Tropilaelaps mercedesae]|uniref:Large ribosomal subunit protein bL20m n=1 Tax=Tropilaelaps mercedesae TaxID=418985 RepID=A0A1V9XP50_9ACAR|nr:39S ribosomal protein L20 [Tropilaelaps mercedesae]